MNFADYENKIQFPSKQYITYVYEKGQVKYKFETNEEFNEWRKNSKPKVGQLPPHERVWINEDSYNDQKKAYYENENILHEKFKNDLYVEFGVENNPKRDICFSKACDNGPFREYSDVYNTFSYLVELIV